MIENAARIVFLSWDLGFNRLSSSDHVRPIITGTLGLQSNPEREQLITIVRVHFSGPLFQLYFHQSHTHFTHTSPLHDLCPHQDQEKTMSSTAKNVIPLQSQAANKVYESMLFPSKSKSSPLSTPYPASTTSSTRLVTSSS